MTSLKSLAIVSLVAVSFSVSAQTPKPTVKNVVKNAQQTVQEVKPNIIKKLPEKQQAMYDQMAKDLSLTEDQKNQVITLAMERAVSLSEKMKTATTEEQKTELKKASGVDYNAKLEKAFGAETAEKIKEWTKQNTLKQKAAAAQAK